MNISFTGTQYSRYPQSGQRVIPLKDLTVKYNSPITAKPANLTAGDIFFYAPVRETEENGHKAGTYLVTSQQDANNKFKAASTESIFPQNPFSPEKEKEEGEEFTPDEMEKGSFIRTGEIHVKD